MAVSIISFPTSNIAWCFYSQNFQSNGDWSQSLRIITEIDDKTWIIGDTLLLSLTKSPSSNSTWNDGIGSYYIVSEAQKPLPPLRPLPATSQIKMVHTAGGQSAVWSICNAFCKVKILEPDVTKEHVTLEHLHRKTSLSQFQMFTTTQSILVDTTSF